MDVRTIAGSDYDRIIASDRALYPTLSPVTPDVIAGWYRNNPEFGSIFERDGQVCGVCVAIPLNDTGWEKLIAGEVPESQLDDRFVFKPGRDRSLALHIYHIERTQAWPQGQPFHIAALSRLQDSVGSLRHAHPDLSLEGFSALCVTAEGAALFAKLGCSERDFIGAEHVLRRNGRLEVFHASSDQVLRDKLQEGYELVCRCKMLVSRRREPGVVWTHLTSN
jgi:hypothetical protein